METIKVNEVRENQEIIAGELLKLGASKEETEATLNMLYFECQEEEITVSEALESYRMSQEADEDSKKDAGYNLHERVSV